MDQKLIKLLKCINRLQNTERNKINEISMLAEAFKNDDKIARQISEVIMSKISNSGNEFKLGYFYAMDSIVKNICEPFNKYFSESLVETFVDTFKSCKETNTRESLYKLRLTWKDKQFPYEITNELDLKVRAIDPNWPVIKRRTTEIDNNNNNRKRKSVSPEQNTEECKTKMIRLEDSDVFSEVKKEEILVKQEQVTVESWSTADILSKFEKIPILKNILATTMNLPINKSPIMSDNSPILTNLQASSSPNTSNNVPLITNNSLLNNLSFMSSNPPANNGPFTANNIPFVTNNTPANNASFLTNNPPTNNLAFMTNNTTNPLITNPAIYEGYSSANSNNFGVFPKPPPVTMFNNTAVPFNTNMPPSQPIQNFNQVRTDRNAPRRNYPHFWFHSINGFPQMPKIGMDPRLLFKCPYADTPKMIKIENDEYLVLLDRIHPYVILDGFAYAIRFVCSYINVVIDGANFELPTNEVSFVCIRNILLPLCIGGPFHEIIIDGWPYNVPMTGETFQIKLGNQTIDIAFNVKKAFRLKIMNPIPKFICNWAEAGFFGHPRNMSLPPVNPLKNPELRDPISDKFRMELQNNHVNNPVVTYSVPNTVYPTSNGPLYNNYQNEKDLAMSSMSRNSPNVLNNIPPIIRPTNIESPPKKIDVERDLDFTKYKFDIYKKFNSGAVKSLSGGIECDICGMRFRVKASPEFDAHLDYHFYKTSINIQSKLKSRGFSKGSKVWVLGKQSSAESEKIQDETMQPIERHTCPKFDDWNLNKCSVCNDRFAEEWVDEDECYMLINAIMLDGKVYHPICIEDVGKSFKVEEEIVESQEVETDSYQKTDPFSILDALLKGGFQIPKD